MSFREALVAGERLLGTIVTVADASMAELISAPFDFVWLDLEHGTLDVSDLPALLSAVRAGGAAAVVRLPHRDTERLPAILDAGVDGVVAPRVDSAAQAEAFVRQLLFPPAGSRGFGPRRAGGYGRTARFWSSKSADVAALVQIESRAAVAASPQIAAVDRVDGLILGPADLSFDFGKPQEFDDPEFRRAVESVRVAASQNRKAFGAAAGTPTAIDSLLDATGTVAVLSVDVRLYAAAVDAAAGELRTMITSRVGAAKP